jgi:adenosine deaminase
MLFGMPQRIDLRQLPKVELHRHLDGSVRLSTILDLAEKHGLDVGARTIDDLRRAATVTRPMNDLTAVLACFDTMQRVLCSAEAIRRVTFENIEDAWRDGVKLLELRFAPAFIARGKKLSNDEIIEAVLDGLALGMFAHPIEVGLIGILPRSFPLEDNARAARDLVRWRSGGAPHAERICGLDLADSEDGVDPAAFVPLVEIARGAGMGITIHSGENTSGAHVRRTLDLFSPCRIGHGIKAWGDDESVRRLRDRDVILEISPTSNWLTRSVPSIRAHPLPRLYRAGVSVCINSDDPHLMGIDLVHEYEICRRHYGFTEKDFNAVNRMALTHSFLPDEVKERVLSRHFSS